MNAIELNNVKKIYKIYDKPIYRVVDSVFGSKHYREYHALKGITLNVEKGEAVGVLGKNGAGKSTLLKILTGVTTPTEGSVNINGKIAAILELNSGFDEELSGRENIFLKGTILGYSKDEILEKLEDIINFADIGRYIDQPVRTYSSGMKTRLGFAIAVNSNPDVLIIDEALSVGDDIFKTKCLAKMTEFRKAGVTIFFVSHSMFNVKSFCTKCAWIKDGELVEYGEIGKVSAMYETFLKEEKAKQKAKAKKDSIDGLERKDYIKISKFKFNAEKDTFKYGEDIEYSFFYDVKKEFEGLRWSFTVWDAEGNEIYSTDKTGDDYNVESSLGKYKANIKIKDIPLLPGKYLLSGEIRDVVGMIYVGYANKKPFIVESDNYNGSGITYLSHECHIDNAKKENKGEK